MIVSNVENTIKILLSSKQDVLNIRSILEKEIQNEEIDLVYNGNECLNNYCIYNLKYPEIVEVVRYLKDRVSIEDSCILNRKLNSIKIGFLNELLSDASCSKNPLSFSLYLALESLKAKIKIVNENNSNNLFPKDLIVIDINQLDMLETEIERLIGVKQKFMIEQKDYLRRKKASSDYIKRNKK